MKNTLPVVLLILAVHADRTHAQAPGTIPPPKVDHHAHIASLAISERNTDPILPRVELPPELDRLVHDREAVVKSKDWTVAAPLFTRDALFMNALGPNWLKGEAAVRFASQNTGSFPLYPVAYGVSDSAGFIAGTWTIGAGDSLRHVTNFLMSIVRGSDGRWRIAAETITAEGPPVPEASTPEALIGDLDAAGIGKAVVLSVAYQYGSPHDPPVANEYEMVRKENDWVAEQVARHPDRLIGYFGVNPMSPYALEELERCRMNPHFKGIKLHFGNSGVDVLNSDHVRKVQEFFRAANAAHLPLVVHVWTLGVYGPEHARAFLDDILPAAPDIPIQIAHLAGTGPGYDADDAMAVYAEAVAAGDPRTKNLYFDVASNVTERQSEKTLALIAKRLRQVGLSRVLFATDRNGRNNEPPKDAWAAFLRLPLSAEEFRGVAENVAPWLR